MTLCLIGDCINMSCPAALVILAWIGIFVLWFLLGAFGTFLTYIVVGILEGREVKPEYYLSILGPIMLIMGGFLWIGAWILTPILFGKYEQLKRKMEGGEGNAAQDLINDSSDSDDEEEEEDESEEEKMEDIFKPRFKVGDILTGIEGNPDGYKIVYDGCKCKVISIDNKGSMQLLLLDHVDKEAQQKNFGNVYKGPARNFVLYSESKYAPKKAKKIVRKGKKKKA